MAYNFKPAEGQNAAPVLARVDGWPIHLADQPSAISRIIDKAREGAGFTVFTMNLDHMVKLRTNTAFRDAYARADFITADGEPVAWLSRLQGADIKRTTGADMFIPLATAAARENMPVYLFGSSMPVLTKSANALAAASAGRIRMAGLKSPSMTFDPFGSEADAAIEDIKASGARICFVALSPPKNEIFSARAVAKGCKCGFVCVGAAVDFVAGTQIRAPQIVQRYGLEWAWRLCNNPRRLGKRYADCARVLLDVAVIAPVWHNFGGREI
ncbi:MAG: WecB/TagA/CpsF family glycosyltransferase [Hyphomicrobiaceae bacterium]